MRAEARGLVLRQQHAGAGGGGVLVRAEARGLVLRQQHAGVWVWAGAGVSRFPMRDAHPILIANLCVCRRLQ